MQLKLKLVIGFSLLFLTSYGVDDSTGVILRNNKVFILHKVEAGQGLFGVARRYKTVWTKVRDANPGSETNITPGEILLVPTGKSEQQFFGNKTPKYSKNYSEYAKPIVIKKVEKEKITETNGSSNSPKTNFTIFYTVKQGETLFSIARKFGTTADFLKQLNQMQDYIVATGKDILVPMVETTPTDSIIARKKEEVKKIQKELDEITAKIDREKKRERDRQDSMTKPIIKQEIKTEPVNKVVDNIIPSSNPSEYTIKIENMPEFEVEKVTETGYGKVMIDNTIDQTKDWVIHHNAPEGTALQLTNTANDKTIYVKVVKNFKRIEGDPLILYITKNTADYLELNKKEKFNIKIIFAK